MKRTWAGFVALVVATAATGAHAEGKLQGKRACAAAMQRGTALRNSGKYLAAHAAFAECARPACAFGIARTCGARLHALDAVTPTVIARAKDDSGVDLPSARLTLDGTTLPDPPGGKPLLLDPGEHTFHFEAPGAPTVEKAVVIRSGEKDRVIAVVMHPPPPAPATPVLATAHADPPNLGAGNADATPPSEDTHRTQTIAPGEPAPHLPPPEAPTSRQSRGGAIAGISLLALGLAAGAAGEYFVIQSNQEEASAANLQSAVAPGGCSRAGSALCSALSKASDTEQRDLVIGRTLLGVGVGLAVVAATTWLLWPNRRSSGRSSGNATAWLAPAPTQGGGGLELGGTF